MNADRDSFDELVDGVVEDGPRLSPRQRELIALIARGASNKQIARTLGITEGTVKQHLSTLYKKLGVNSRTKAIVRATELFGLRAGHPDPLPSESALPEEYAWRLVTAAAFVVMEPKGLSVVEQTQLERGLRAFHQHLKRLTEALDGQLLIAPGGNMLAGFGAPHSHLDDAARALYVTRAAAAWLRDQAMLTIGMGVAAAPTLVGFGNEPLYRSKAYDLAFDLAHQARAGTALCSALVCKLGGLLFAHRALPEATTNKTPPGLIVRELSTTPIDATAFAGKASLPFIAEILAAARLSTAQWVDIAGWPPSATLQLLDAISLHCEAGGFATYRLRLPNERDPSSFAVQFHRQLRLVSRLRERTEGNELYDASTSDASRSLAAIKLLCMRGPTALVVYGLEGLSSLSRLLGESGIAQLSTLPLVVVVAEGVAEAAPHVTARLLGPRPLSGKALKTFRLPLGRAAASPDDLHRDLATLLSTLSSPARQAVRLFIVQDKTSMVSGVKAGAQHLANELVTSGLFVREGESIICRDAITRTALKRFFQPHAAG